MLLFHNSVPTNKNTPGKDIKAGEKNWVLSNSEVIPNPPLPKQTEMKALSCVTYLWGYNLGFSQRKTKMIQDSLIQLLIIEVIKILDKHPQTRL